MVQISYGDMAQASFLRRHTAATKLEITRLSDEVTTGLASDTARHLSGNLGGITALDASLARLAAYKTATTELAMQTTATQSGLGVISDLVQTAAGALLPATGMANTAQVDAAALTARQGFETALTTLNARLGDRSLFAGQAIAGAAVSDAETLLSGLEVLTAGAQTAEEVASTVTAWFDDPAGYGSSGYLGGDALAAIPVADGESAAPDVTANDPALRRAMAGLALGALLDRGLFAGQPEARRELAGKTGQSLTAAQTGLTYLSARLGATEAQIDAAESRNAAEASALGIGRNDLLGVDGYDSATRLQDAEARLDLLFALTARLSRLSLAEYI